MKKNLFYFFIAWSIGALGIAILSYLNSREKSNFLTLLAEVVIIFYFVIIYIARKKISSYILLIQPILLRFLLLGLLGCVIFEALYYFILNSSESFLFFLSKSIIWYIIWLSLWFFISKKYVFKNWQIFFFGGLNGYIVEGFLLKQFNPFSALGIFIYPLIAMPYGLLLVLPFLLNKFQGKKEIALYKKFIISFIPLIGFFINLIFLRLIVRI